MACFYSQIPVVAAVEGVGQNLQDHITVNYLPFHVNDGEGVRVATQFSVPALLTYGRNKTGR